MPGLSLKEWEFLSSSRKALEMSVGRLILPGRLKEKAEGLKCGSGTDPGRFFFLFVCLLFGHT